MTPSSIVYYPGPWYVGGAESYALNIARAMGTFGKVAILSGSRPENVVIENLRLPADFDPEWRLASTCSQMNVDRLAGGTDIFVNCSPWDYPTPPRGTLSAMIAYYAPQLRSISFPEQAARAMAARVRPRRVFWPAPLATLARYDKVLCVSEWTAKLAAERWGRTAGVLYPAVRSVPSLTKERLILTVGRIGAGGTRKGHADLIDAFLRGKPAGWRLVVAGAVNYGEAVSLVEGWRKDLQGTEVELVTNPTKTELEELYGRASIYWHGAGFGATPDSVGREHFGISVVEAMSAGAIPVAFEGGGVREIITSGVDGILWNTLDELTEATQLLARDANTACRLRAQAKARARFFGIERHDGRLRELLVRPVGGG